MGWAATEASPSRRVSVVHSRKESRGAERNVQDMTLQAACRHGGYLLLVPARFGEHAQIEHGSCSVFVLDDHERVVENVGYFVALEFVEMIHILRTTCHDANR